MNLSIFQEGLQSDSIGYWEKMNCIIEPTSELGGLYLGNCGSSTDVDKL